MADQNRDQDRPNRASNMEQAEGSRDTVESGGGGAGTQGGGITNRDLGREQAEQQRVPDRGESRETDQEGR